MRKEMRFGSNALVYLVDSSKKETKAHLKELGLNGLSIRSDDYIDIEPKNNYTITIVPEKESKIKQFQLDIRSRWVKLNKSKMEAGFSVKGPLSNSEFQDYLEYIAMRGKIKTFPDEEETSKASD